MTESIFTTNGLSLSIVLALVGLGVAVVLIRKILASSAGNERMGQIAGAVQEGANAYLSRQTRAVSIIAVLMVVAVMRLVVVLLPSVSSSALPARWLLVISG